MAQVLAQSALMPQMRSAGPIKPKGSFSVVKDAHGEPIIFFIASDDRLHMVYKGPTGNNLRIILSSALGIKSAVTKFAISQDATSTIYLVFVSKRSTSGASSLSIVRPVRPETINWQARDLTHLLLSGDQQDVAVDKILLGGTPMSTSTSTIEYPLLYVSYRREGMSTDDIRAVVVQQDEWQFKEALSFKDAIGLPENPRKMLNMVIGRLLSYSGLFILYQMDLSGPVTLGLLGYDEEELADQTISLPTTIWIPLRCPPMANSLAIFEDAEKSSSLVVGGQGLFHYKSQEALAGTSSTFRTITKDNVLSGIKQLHIAQDGENFTLWALNENSELVYQQFTVKDELLVPRSPAVPLLSGAEGGGRFSAIYNAGNTQEIFSLGAESQMNMLMQDDQTRFWQGQLVIIPTLDRYIEFQSYTTQVRITRDGFAPIPKAEVCLSCSSRIELTVNGSTIYVGPVPCVLQANDSGVLTIIATATDLSTPIYRISKAPSSSLSIEGGTVLINPMACISDKLGDIKSAGDLKKISSEDGTKLIESSVNGKDLDNAANAIQDLHKKMGEFSVEDFADKASGDPVLVTGDGSWALEKLDKGFKLVIKLAKGVWEFVVDTTVKAYKAVTKVFEAIGAGISKLLNALSGLFNWGDIIDTKNILVNVLNLGMLWGHGQIDTLKEKAYDFFEDQKKLVASLEPSAMPPELKNSRVGKDTAKSKKNESDNSKKEAEGPTGNFGSYQLEHRDNGVQELDTDHQVGDVFGNLVANLKGTIAKLKSLFSRLWDNIKELFKDGDVSIEQLLLKLGTHLAADVLNVLQSIACTIIEVIGDLFAQVAIQGNKVRKVPVFSALYRRITGNDLSVIDAVCLVLAIPAILSFKALSEGKKPKDVESIAESLQPGKYWDKMKSTWHVDDDGTPQRQIALNRTIESAPTIQMNSIASSSFKGPGTGGRNQQSSSIMKIANQLPPSHPMVNLMSMPGKTEINLALEETAKWAKAQMKRMFEVLRGFFKMIVPGIGACWFIFYTFPGWFVDKGVPSKWKGTFKTIYYSVKWFISIPHIPTDAIEEDDRQFVHLFGLSNVFTGYLPKEISAVIVGGTSFFQILTLVWLQIKTFVRKKTYPATLAVEEWIVVLGKLVGSMAALSQGVEPISCVGGFALVTGGYAISDYADYGADG